MIGHLDDLHTLAYDRRGYARSIGTDPPAASIASGVDDLLGLLDGRPATVVGHSFGGHVALAAGIARPDVVRAVAVWEAPLAWLDWWPSDSAGSVAVAAPTPHAAAETFLRLLLGDDTWERLPPGTQAVRRLEGPALLGDLAAIRNKGQPPYDWAQLRVPLLVGHGSVSKPHHIRSARLLADEVPGADLVVIDGAGHGAHVSHAREFAAFVRQASLRGEAAASAE